MKIPRAEINCPHCGELRILPVDDPMGEQSYQCGECTGEFSVDWVEQKVTWER